jgi:ABC-type xylose transport system substrate-binding protein
VFVAGADADAANVDFVCQGKQSIEVLKDIQPLAETAAEVAAELLRPSTRSARSGRTAAVAVEVIRAGDVKRRLVDSGFLSASEVPSCPK